MVFLDLAVVSSVAACFRCKQYDGFLMRIGGIPAEMNEAMKRLSNEGATIGYA
jgi:hypothetical protein